MCLIFEKNYRSIKNTNLILLILARKIAKKEGLSQFFTAFFTSNNTIFLYSYTIFLTFQLNLNSKSR